MKIQNLQEQLDNLRNMEDRSSLEFYQYLRLVLKSSYHYSFTDLVNIIEEFYTDIMEHGIFYMDIINKNLIFFLKKQKKLQTLQKTHFLFIMAKLVSICDRQSLTLFKYFIKKLSKTDIQYMITSKKYMEQIQNNLSDLSIKIKEHHLHPYKDIIDRWY